jgi:hypothetical protein
LWLLCQVLLICYFTTFLGGWPAGWLAGRVDAGYIKIKAKLSPVEINWGLAELGNMTMTLHHKINKNEL